jgi:hypothetical protein
MWREDVFDFDNLENVPGKPGSSTAMLIEYLENYLVPHPEIVEAAEKEYKTIWYSQKKKEILRWYEFKKGYKEAIQNYTQRLRYIKQQLPKLEEMEWEYRLVVNRKKLQERLKKLLNEKRFIETRLAKYIKRYKEFEEWVPGEEKKYRETSWWKKGLAMEPPSMDRIIQRAIEDYWKNR